MTEHHPIYTVPTESITYIISETHAEELLKQCLSSARHVSLDLEWHPGAEKDQISVISMAWVDQLVVIHLSLFDGHSARSHDPDTCLPTLRLILESEEIVKFGVNIRGELPYLQPDRF